MMDDALEDALDGDGVEEETDEVVSQVRRVWWTQCRQADARWAPIVWARRDLDLVQSSIAHPFVLQVLDSIGIDLTAGLGSVPKQRLPAKQQQQQVEPDEEDELASRLAALK